MVSTDSSSHDRTHASRAELLLHGAPGHPPPTPGSPAEAVASAAAAAAVAADAATYAAHAAARKEGADTARLRASLDRANATLTSISTHHAARAIASDI